MLRRLPCSTLFPYTTLFRSEYRVHQGRLTTRLVDVLAGLRVLNGLGGKQFVADRYGDESQRLLAVPAGDELLSSDEHTSELQSQIHLVCRPLLANKTTFLVL